MAAARQERQKVVSCCPTSHKPEAEPVPDTHSTGEKSKSWHLSRLLGALVLKKLKVEEKWVLKQLSGSERGCQSCSWAQVSTTDWVSEPWVLWNFWVLQISPLNSNWIIPAFLFWHLLLTQSARSFTHQQLISLVKSICDRIKLKSKRTKPSAIFSLKGFPTTSGSGVAHPKKWQSIIRTRKLQGMVKPLLLGATLLKELGLLFALTWNILAGKSL